MTNNGYIDRAALLQPRAKERRVIRIDELGGELLIEGMTAFERGKFEASFVDKRSGEQVPARVMQFRERLTIAVCINPDGTHMFSMEDMKSLGEVDVRILDRICDAAKDLTGIDGADFEELVGNSDETPVSGSQSV